MYHFIYSTERTSTCCSYMGLGRPVYTNGRIPRPQIWHQLCGKLCKLETHQISLSVIVSDDFLMNFTQYRIGILYIIMIVLILKMCHECAFY